MSSTGSHTADTPVIISSSSFASGWSPEALPVPPAGHAAAGGGWGAKRVLVLDDPARLRPGRGARARPPDHGRRAVVEDRALQQRGVRGEDRDDLLDAQPVGL